MAEEALIASVQESLSFFQYDNARFLGERLVALKNSEHNQQLLATCYMRCNQAYRAYHLLKGHNSQCSRYLLAVCCMNMSRYPEAKDTLLKMGESEIPFSYMGLYLLGRICRLTNSMSEAKDYFFRALRLNPLLWCAYEELCSVGGDDEAAEVCSLAQLSPPTAAEGPSPSSSSQISTALARHSHPPHGQQHPQHPQPSHNAGLRHQGHLPSKEPHRTPGQLHLPAGPAGTSIATGPGFRGGGGFGFTGFGVAAGGAGGPPPPSTGPSLPSLGASGGGGTMLFQTPVPGQGGIFASPVPAFGVGNGAGGVSSGAFSFGFGYACGAGGGGGGGGVGGPAGPAPSGLQPSGSDGDGVPSTVGQLFRFSGSAAASAGGGGGGGGCIFATPAPAGPGQQPPAPPQKQPQPQSHGHSEVPFPGFAAGGHSGPGSAGAGPSGPEARHSGAGGGGHGRISRMVDEGKVRKVSNKLFSDPRSSVRRSQRLAALNSATTSSHGAAGGPGGGRAGTGGAQHHHASHNHNHHQQQQQQPYTPVLYGGGPSAGGGGGGGGAASMQGQAKSGQASYVEGDSQNMPDPRDPPPAPVHQQLHPSAKLAAPGAAVAGPGAGTPQQLVSAFSTHGGSRQPGQGAADALLSQHTPPPPPPLLVLVAACPTLQDSRSALLALLGPLMEGVRHLAAYRSIEATTALSRMPLAQYRTAWVMCAVGKAHFEGLNYARAAQSFEQARQLDRTRLEGMELYSSVLWHTGREYELSHLAQECVATDRLAPQTWCVMGNLFSAQKEHETAIDFFLRAAQVDPTFTYAYTLAGHEYFANEEYDKAAACFRSALKLDPRHHNAMFGLGRIAYSQEKFSEALQHFRLAVGVNPRSSVLRCYVGMSAAKMGQHMVALEKLQEAIELDGANPLARYERAAVLAVLDRVPEALSELENLQRLTPRAAGVAFQIGKLHKRLNDLNAAQRSFELALSCSAGNSGDAALIKAAIERLGLSEDEEEQEM